jgi:anaerobic selenocysteine-containing dehydrogenase
VSTPQGQARIPGYCALCWSSCGCISIVEDGKLVAVEPDPAHPTGLSLCGKGQAAPDYIYSDARVLYPMKRTRPKGAADPGWERISWDEALDLTAAAIERIRKNAGSEAIAFSITTSAGTAMQDSYPFVERLRHAIGTPNAVASIELCDFSKDFVYPHTFGVSMPTSEVENSDCIILWGHNPGTTWLAFATRITAARRRGAKLVVMDPVRVGFAAKADQWLRVRPGSDGALALSLAHVLIDEQLFDAAFVRDWTNGPFLVRDDNGAMLTGADLGADGHAGHRVLWDSERDVPVLYDTRHGECIGTGAGFIPALDGRYLIACLEGELACQPAFARYADLCSEYAPERAAAITWIDAEQIRLTARLIGASQRVSCYSWAGLEMHSNTSQTGRAIACLYALTGCFDAPGGNVIFERVPVRTLFGQDMLPDGLREKSLGREQRPLGPEAIFGWITTDALYKSVLERKPYGVDALVSFGLNLLLSHADGERGGRALEQLEFMVHADLFMTPTAHHADIFLPVNSPWEREGLRTDFHADQRASAHVQLRPQVIEPRGESRSDAWIAIELARRLGFGDAFWNGDMDAARREMLEPSGLDLETLRAQPHGVTLPLTTRYRKYAGNGTGSPPGFATPSRRVELYSETFFKHGYAALPEYVEPAMGPVSRADLAVAFPLVLTDGKSPHFIHSQYRHVGRLRRHERDPCIEVHPDAAAARGIKDGDWVKLTTPHGRALLRARFTSTLDPRVVRASAGWWQSCAPLSLPGYDAMQDHGANLNRAIGNEQSDPVGGCVAHKSYLCNIERAARQTEEVAAETL